METDSSVTEILERVASRLAGVTGIDAVVLGGSRARGTADAHSDIDFGLYYDSRRAFRIAELERAARELDDRGAAGLVTPFGAWGQGVNGGGWLRIGGHHVDFLYRDLVAVGVGIDECRAGDPKTIYQLGHPYGFHNQIYAGEVNCCRILFDRGSQILRLKRLVARYPEKLRRAIARKHLFDAAFELAIADKAALRGDVMYVSGCLFRAASFMTIVAYAMNRRWLINEKGALEGLRSMPIRPRAADATIVRVLANPGRTPDALARSVGAMKSLCGQFRALAARQGIALIDSGF
ncbi:MAG TPA: nucleotidyltransferase domain-containing protein [Candidatus Binataceae bacterium]|nr:nucleotidyltransferase domain-containing protein [Candidatus Binataceae bacterium]